MIEIGGLQKITLIDFPGRIACTVFLCGCDFRCPWCYNREIVLPKEIRKQLKIPEKELFDLLKERKGLLEGVCLSIAGNEPVVIRNSKLLKHLPIEKLWDNTKPVNYRIYPIPHEYQKINFESLTKDGFKRAKEIIRHKTKKLYEIIASPGNYNVKLTDGHSIFVLTKKGLEVKKVNEIKKGDFLLSANSGIINHSHQIKIIDLIDYLPFSKDWIITKTHIRHKFSNLRMEIPRKVPIDKQLCEFLGYAVAEGSSKYRYFKKKKTNVSGYQFSLGDEPSLAKKILRLYRSIFNSKAGTIYKKINLSGAPHYIVIVGNSLVAKFINKLIGEGFIQKHIPTIIFNTTPENKIAFLKALIEGDGHKRIRQKRTQQELSIKTSSPYLAADIIFLTNTLGVFSWIEENRKRPGHEKSFRVVISSNFFDKLGLEKQIKTNYSFSTRIKGIPKVLVDYALRGQKRINVERLKKWINLFNISKEKKRVGIRFGFLTKKGNISTKTKRIQFLYNLVKNWDIKEIKLIKKIKLKQPQYVYDLVVPGDHSFIGGTGSFLLHNSGGEPTINKKLPSLIKKIKKLGYLVKLDTNGSNPKVLEKLINNKLVDYVAMDIKLPKERYPEIFGKRVKIDDIEKSIKILKEGKVDYEFRTTVVPTILNKEDILKIARWIGPAKKYFLQNFRPEKTIDPKFEKIKPYPQEYLLEIQKAISPFFEICQVR